MLKAVIIGSDDLVNTLHALNLSAYVGLETFVAKEKPWAEQLIQKHKDCNLIVIGLTTTNAAWTLGIFDKFKNKPKTQVIFYNQDPPYHNLYLIFSNDERLHSQKIHHFSYIF